jgi:lipooligosaccharide transport system ATP-binding protein
MEIVTVRGLVKDYNSLRAVNGVSFTINRGESFGFLGPNGAGKTTVMRVLYCFIVPTGGSVKVFGLDVGKEPSRIKARIGVMPQEDSLDPELSVRENLIVYARYFDIPRSRSSTVAADLLEYVGLSDKADVAIRDLSGGMKRSLLLARALINSPEILILDEPTTGLDPHSRNGVWNKLRDLKANGTTLLLTTHYMEEAERLCDRVAIMDCGAIVAIDTPHHLMEVHGGNLEDVFLKLTGKRLEN